MIKNISVLLMALCCHITAYPLSNDKDSLCIVLQNYKTLIANDSINHNFKAAFVHLKEKEAVSQKLFAIQKDQIIHDSIKHQPLEMMHVQIADLNEKLKKAEGSILFRMKMTIVMEVLVCCLLIIAFLLIFRHKRNLRVNSVLLVENSKILDQLEELTLLTQKYEIEIQQLMHNNEQLETTNAAKDKLLSIISHDLRSPISSLQALLSLFNSNNIARAELVDFFGKLLSRVENTSTMLENLLHWSKNQLKGLEPIVERVNLQATIDECINLYRMQAEQKHILIDNSLKTDVHVCADVEMLKVILRNLISNALKFTHSGGIITIISMTKEKFAVISVKDTGVGISPENQIKLFAMDNMSTLGTEKEKGTGLGLMLCKDFAKHNHGKIWLDSKLNVGTTFYFSIPLFETT